MAFDVALYYIPRLLETERTSGTVLCLYNVCRNSLAPFKASDFIAQETHPMLHFDVNITTSLWFQSHEYLPPFSKKYSNAPHSTF